MAKRKFVLAGPLIRPGERSRALYRTLKFVGWPLIVSMLFLAFSPGLSPVLAADCDGDGLTDSAERSAGTHPCRADTDEDGLKTTLR